MPWEKVMVTGVKGWKGELEGELIDSGKVFVEERFDDRNNTEDQFGQGTSSVSYGVGSAAKARELLGLKFPLVIELNFERVTNGRGGSKTIVTDFRVPQAKAA